MAESAVQVFVQIAGEDVFAGRLWSHQRRVVESATFTYADEYLQRNGYALDPALPLSAGQHQTRVGQALFGAFTDCSPDRWGRRLINRAEKARAGRDGAGARHSPKSTTCWAFATTCAKEPCGSGIRTETRSWPAKKPAFRRWWSFPGC